jgi:hypothetical protein
MAEGKNPIRYNQNLTHWTLGIVFVILLFMINVLCVATRSNYHLIEDLNLYTQERNAYTL